jgi:hypothetical protein
MSEPSGFLDYTTFTWRLFCYAKLFKEAIKQFVVELNVRSAPHFALCLLLTPLACF